MYQILASVLLFLLLTQPASGQGTVNFNNRVLTDSIDAHITDSDGTTRLSGDAFLAQFYAGRTATTLAAVGAAVPFRTGAAAGYVDVINSDPLRTIPGVVAGTSASVQVRAWAKSDGATYELASAKGGKAGASAILTIATGGAGNPPSLPANLRGLRPFSLVSGIAPKITQQPANSSVNVGATVTFSVLATGTDPISYQWRKNGASISGRTTQTLTLSNVQMSDAGTYSVIVKNNAGQVTSANAALNINAAPQITTQPESIYEKPAATVRFSAAATGSPTPTYQWQFNGANLAGATSASLTLNSVQQAQEGTYVLVARNSSGQAVSEPAVLLLSRSGGTVTFANRDTASGIDAPVFDADGVTRLSGTSFLAQMYAGLSPDVLSPVGPAVPFRVGIASGYWLGEPQSTRFVTRVAAGAQAFVQTRVWESAKGKTFEEAAAAGSKLGGSETLVLTTGGGGSPPSIPAVMAGLSSFKLIQGTAPRITTQPLSLSVNSGATATFRVVATGTTPLTYAWKLNNTRIEGATSSTLTIKIADSTAAGNYTVDVINLYGKVTSAAASLAINTPPEIVVQPVSARVAAGASALFSVTAKGSLPLTYQWRLNGVNISGATSSTLSRSTTSTANEGSYSVLVSNPVGKIVSDSAVLLAIREGGTVLFINRDVNTGIDAKVLNIDNTPLQGETHLAQLYAAPPGETLAAVGPAVPFRTGVAAGYWLPEPEPTRYITTVKAGDKAQIQVRVWEIAKGSSFEKAAAAGGNLGFSEVLTFTTGGAGSPPGLPPNLVGLKSFKMGPATPPALTKQPISLAVNAGSPAVFEVSASGTEPLSYQWRKNGAPIESATGTRLTIAKVSTTDEGAYTVEVRNPLNSVVSSTAFLTVNAAPQITLQPSSTSTAQGSNLSLSVQVTGSTPFTFQWRRNGKDLPGATGASLSLQALQPPSQGTYQVLVRNAFGSALSEAAILLIPNSGGSLNFVNRDIANGIDAPVTDTDGVTRLSGASFLTQLYAGKTESELVPVGPAIPFRSEAAAGYWSTSPSSVREIPGVRPGEKTLVQARVWEISKGSTFDEALANRGKIGLSDLLEITTGGAGSPPSLPADLPLKPFKLTFGELPKITAQPVGLTKNQGESAIFKVVASGTDPLGYQWLHEGHPIEGAVKSVYTIDSVQASHAGSYLVEVTNPLGKIVSAEATLVANTKPFIVTHPESIQANPSQRVSLTVEAIGSSPISYQWFLNGLLIPGATSQGLLIGAVSSQDEGTYTVEVKNPFGLALSDPSVILLTQAGGTVAFLNRDIGSGIDARVFDTDGQTPLAGTSFLAQLWAGPSANQLAPIGPAVPFRSAQAAGYWNPGPNVSRSIPSVPPGETAFVQARVWQSGKGHTFEDALAQGSAVGLSDLLRIPTGGVGNPPSLPVSLSGLKSFRLFMGTPPSITQHPLAASAKAGDAVSFKVTVTGTDPIAYQWQLNEVDIPEAVKGSLNLPSVTLEQAGSYRVRVSNNLGSILSQAAKLEVLTAPTILANPESATVARNARAEFKVVATGANPLQFQWFLNGSPIPNATSDTFLVAAATESDQGTYSVSVSNSLGARSSNGAVLLLQSSGGTVGFVNRVVGSFDAPVFASDGLTRLSGMAFLAQLYAGASPGTLQPVGPAVPFRTGIAAGYWSSEPNPVRFLSTVTPGDKAAVQVKVWPAASGKSFEAALAAGAETGVSEVLVLTTGGAGNPPSLPTSLDGLQSFSLRKGSPPVILIQPSPNGAVVGGAASFRIVADGTQPLRYQWRFNGKDILGETRAELLIPSVQASQAGAYSVLISNPYGDLTSATATLTIQEAVLAGVAQDGYIARGTVFLDLNRNGFLDLSEPSTTTDDQGRFSLPIKLSLYDRNKNGKLDPDEGVLVLIGGLDISTGLPVIGSLQAPGDSTVINPLTTLVQKVVDQNPTLGLDGAESAVKAAFSIPASVDLSTFDPIKASSINDAASTVVLGAAAKIQDTVTQIAALLGGTTFTKTEGEIANSVTDVLAQTIIKSTVVELSNKATLQTVIQTTAAIDGINVEPGLAEGAATIIADGNILKDQFTSSGSNASFIATELARIQGITQGAISDRLAESAQGSTPIEETVTSSTGAALVNLVRNAPVGDVTGADIRTGTFSLTMNSLSVDEAAQISPLLTIIRKDGNQGQVSLDLSFKDGTARTDLGDYAASPLRVTFLDGEISKSIDWATIIKDDDVLEASETFTLSLSLTPGSPVGAQLGVSAATVEIVDNDSIGTFNFSSASADISEGGSTSTRPLLITRSGGASGQVTLLITTQEEIGSARAGLDFDATPFQVAFAPGQISKIVSIPVKEDREPEKDETFMLKLALSAGSPKGAGIGQVSQCRVTIKDNEFVFGAPRLTQTGQIQIEGSGEPDRDYTVETSIDLMSWSFLAVKRTDPQGRLSFNETRGASSIRFYRAKAAQ